MGEGGGVVHAVADHRDHPARGLQVADGVELALRGDPGTDVLDAGVVGDGAGGAGVVAGEQDRGQPEPAQSGDGLTAGGLDGVGDADRAARLPVPRHDGHGGARGLVGRDRRGELVGDRDRPLPGDPGGAAGGDHAAVDDALHALTGLGGE